MSDSIPEGLQIDPEKYIKQIETQRNMAMSQAAQCVAMIETLDEQLTQVSEELAQAHRRIAELEQKDSKDTVKPDLASA